jgi:hypothetical protein
VSLHQSVGDRRKLLLCFEWTGDEIEAGINNLEYR